MFPWLRYGLLAILLVPFYVFAIAKKDDSTTFILGKDYLQLQTVATSIPLQKGKISVVEFFNYGCPACYRLEPALQAWLKTKPQYVEFTRIPVIFHQDWLIYAKTYYAVRAMGIAEKVTPILFDAIHKQAMTFNDEKEIATFLGKQGINPTDFQSTYNFSPGIQAQISRADAIAREVLLNNYLIKTYKWEPQIPTLLINGKYLLSSAMVNGDSDKLILVMNYLIQKEYH